MYNDKTITIAPSILSGDFVNMEKTIRLIEMWGGDWIHCDVMDGVYVNNLTFGMPMIAAIRKITKKTLDVHLMITKPEKYIEQFVKAGSDIITFHPDASEDPLNALKIIKKNNVKAGLVFNPNIPLEDYKHLFPYCDMLLIMSVYAGKGGQSFIEDTYKKIKQARIYCNIMGLDIPIEVDGGIGEGNYDKVIEAGGNIIVAGSSIFNSQNPPHTIKIMKDGTK
ncbi:ribulose-phosphate 3-epimerase [bacterium]|nr:ribulose-phosphate 3-epimerase [bacterium]